MSISARTDPIERVRPRQPPVPSTRLTALIVASALFMEQLDSTVLSTALPAMAKSFHVDPLHMSVALTAYLLSLAVFIPASGKIADRLGSRTVFRAAIVLFTLGSVLCGLSQTLPFLVVSRILQGLGGAMMVPVGRLVLLRSVPKSELVSAMSWLMIPATIGPVVGPPLGGFIVTYLSWRWIFDINVPIGILGIVLATLYIEDIREPEPGRFDLIGLILSGIALSCLIFGLDLASRGVIPVGVTGSMIAVAAICAVLYWFHAHRHPDPILNLRLMRIPTFRISVVAGALSRIAVGAVPFLLPMMLQIGFGMSAAQSGLITFSSSAGSLLMRATAQPLLRRLGFRNTLVWVGTVSTLIIAVYAAFRPSWPIALIYAVLLAGGFIQSLQFMAYNTVAYNDVPRAQMSAATSFYTTFQQLFLTLGICIAATTLAASELAGGHAHLRLPDFSIALLVVTTIAMAAPVVSLRLHPDAGAEMSGHHISAPH
ncbi:MAG TPA: MFS transporter [Acetobacteraceae bacterium]|nr:MFS transporter [Acetobacteraceae bacterium]